MGKTGTEHKKAFIGLFLGMAFAGAILALPGIPFEGTDGNLTTESSRDWDHFIGSALLHVGQDVPSGQLDDSLRGKEDDVVPDLVEGSIPSNKSDLLRFYVIHEKLQVSGAEKDLLYLGWVRANTLGSANMDFEFNQSGTFTANGGTLQRTVDDLLITFGFANGGTQVNLGMSRWTETGPCEAGKATPCWGPVTSLSGIAEGSVNEAETLDPIENVLLPALTFGEAVIDLTGSGLFDQDECMSFGNAMVKSRSSDSFTASLKDFIRPIDISVSNCTSITITKNAVPDDSQEFSFTASGGLDPGTFSLDDDGDEAAGLPSGFTYWDKYDGTFTVSEAPTLGWDLTDISCNGTVSATPVEDGAGELTGEVGFDVGIGDSLECTFTNTKRGRIIVDVVTDPAGDPELFQYTLTGGPDAVVEGFSLAGGDAPRENPNLRPGTYQVAQGLLGPDWDPAGAVCSDGSPASAVDLAPGETVLCTFTNVKRGEIQVQVTTDPAGDPAAFELSLGGGPSALSQSFSLSDGDTPHGSGFVLAGSGYAASQTLPAGWILDSASCGNGSPVGDIAIAPGETVLCTFHNIKLGRIRTDKITDPGGNTDSFSFSLASGPSAVSQSFSLTDADAVHDSGFLLPGDGYQLREITGAVGGRPDWDLTSISCTSTRGTSSSEFIGTAGDTGFDPGDDTAIIDLAAGDEVTCEFTNTRRATVIVVEDSVPDGPQDFDFGLDGQGIIESFSLDDDGDEMTGQGLLASSYRMDGLIPGAYTITQADAGLEWDLESISCSDTDGSVGSTNVSTGTASVALSPGQTVTCVFTNLQRGKIVVTKQVVDSVACDDFDPRQWPFAFDPDYGPVFWLTHGQSNESPFLRSNQSYSVSESPDHGWHANSSCLYPDGSTVNGGASVNVPVPPGETVLCTFVNELLLHPGSAGFWRNWRNHYNSGDFDSLLADALGVSSIYDSLFDPNTGEMLDGAFAAIDDVFEQSGGTAANDEKVLREMTSVVLNLGVSKSEDPDIRAMQNNDDICLDCIVELDEYPAGQTLIWTWNPALALGEITIGDILATTESLWQGNVRDRFYSFPSLSEGEKVTLSNIFEGLNQGTYLVADPCAYPERLTCMTLPALPDGTDGVFYSGFLPLAGGASSYTWSLVGGELPPGLVLDPNTGEIFGTPLLNGFSSRTFTFTVELSDGGSPPQTGQRQYSITIHTAPAILTLTLPDAEMDAAYLEGLAITGGAAPLTCLIVGGSLPDGLSLDPTTGVIFGTPPMTTTALPVTSEFTVEVVDSNGASDLATLSISVIPPDTTCNAQTTPPQGMPLLGMVAASGTNTLMWWTMPSGATSYDVVSGDIHILRQTQGDFTLGTNRCLALGLDSNVLFVPDNPPRGLATWFLVRGSNCGGDGSYDAGGAQSGSRDAGIDNVCR